MTEDALRVLVVMGVSGSGKTTVAALLAGRLGWHFEEGDGLHPPENVAKMHAGTPLTDADRRPWLEIIAGVIDRWLAAGESGVITCSALKRAYRDVIVDRRPGVRLVYLRGDPTLVGRRLAARQGHFMPASLLESQFDTLEEPAPDEHALIVSVDGSPEEIVDRIVPLLNQGRG